MNLGGIKVSSAELEETVAPVEGIAEVAAVAVPPPDGGPDRLIIFVVPAASNLDPAALREAMQAEIRAHLNPLFRVHEVVLVDTLPRTASQKVMRRVLREDYSE
jgi:acetyl-CoA synthetase